MTTRKQDFLEQMNAATFLGAVFDNSPDLYVFAKDTNYAFTLCNRALLDRLGITYESDLIGTTDYDHFDRNMADRFRTEDVEVTEKRAAVINRIWHVPNASGGLDWYVSSKYPVFSRRNELIGLFGIMRDARHAGTVLEPYRALATVIDHILKHYDEQIAIGDLARMAQLSVSQLERRFKRLLGMTPLRYINKVRVDAAAQQLVHTHHNLPTIALRCGFYDHSYFTKQFKDLMGQTPSAYRQAYFA